MKTKRKAVAQPFRSIAYRKMLQGRKRRHIKEENGKFNLYSHEGKLLGSHDTREEAVRQEEAVKAQEGKALEEGSGEGGGYTVPDEDRRETKEGSEPEDVARMKGAISDVADSHHEDGALPGHAYHLNPESKDIHHEHPEEEGSERLEAIKGDLEGIEGVGSVTQGTEGPAEDAGYAHTYRTQAEEEGAKKDMDGAGEDEGEDGGGMEEKRKKGCACHKKGWQRKDMADGDPNAPQGDADFQPEPPSDQPHGVGVAQHLIEYLEGEKARAEPECQEFMQSLLEQAQKWASERYPGFEFGGSDQGATGGEGGKPDEAATEEALERYQEYEGKKLKALLKSLDEHPQGQHFRDVVDGAAEHLHDMAHLPEKSFTARHQKKCMMHARALDKVHGMLTKDAGEETIEKPAEPTASTDNSRAEEARTEESGKEDEIDTKAIEARLQEIKSGNQETARLLKENQQALYRTTGKRAVK